MRKPVLCDLLQTIVIENVSYGMDPAIAGSTFCTTSTECTHILLCLVMAEKDGFQWGVVSYRTHAFLCCDKNLQRSTSKKRRAITLDVEISLIWSSLRNSCGRYSVALRREFSMSKSIWLTCENNDYNVARTHSLALKTRAAEPRTYSVKSSVYTLWNLTFLKPFGRSVSRTNLPYFDLRQTNNLEQFGATLCKWFSVKPSERTDRRTRKIPPVHLTWRLSLRSGWEYLGGRRLSPASTKRD